MLYKVLLTAESVNKRTKVNGEELTSILTASTLSMCLLKMCLRTKSGPRNFFPLSGQSHLSFASSWVFASTNFSVSVISVKVKTLRSTWNKHCYYIDASVLPETKILVFFIFSKYRVSRMCARAALHSPFPAFFCLCFLSLVITNRASTLKTVFRFYFIALQ